MSFAVHEKEPVYGANTSMHAHTQAHGTHTHNLAINDSTQQDIHTIGPPTGLEYCSEVSTLVHGMLSDVALRAKDNDEEFRSKETHKDSKSIHHNGQ